MKKIQEEELNMVNGGTVFGEPFDESFGEPKFKVGDRVISKSEPDYGIGIIVSTDSNKGWVYTVKNGGGIRRYRESDLAYPIL